MPDGSTGVVWGLRMGGREAAGAPEGTGRGVEGPAAGAVGAGRAAEPSWFGRFGNPTGRWGEDGSCGVSALLPGLEIGLSVAFHWEFVSLRLSTNWLGITRLTLFHWRWGRESMSTVRGSGDVASTVT
jgi:hypothetical protein